MVTWWVGRGCGGEVVEGGEGGGRREDSVGGEEREEGGVLEGRSVGREVLVGRRGDPAIFHQD